MNDRTLRERYAILRIRRRAYVVERERARQAADHDRFTDTIRNIRRLDAEIQGVLRALP